MFKEDSVWSYNLSSKEGGEGRYINGSILVLSSYVDAELFLEKCLLSLYYSEVVNTAVIEVLIGTETVILL